MGYLRTGSGIPVTVVIPCYNADEYIGRAIKSIINQTHSAWRLIVVDDGSTDNSAAIVRDMD